MKILYYDCFAGISGDMHLGAMIDAGVPVEHLINQFKKLPLDGYRIDVRKEKRKGIEGTRIVITDTANERKKGHDDPSESEKIYSNDDPEGSKESFSFERERRGKATVLSTKDREHQNLDSINKIISGSGFSSAIKKRSRKMFRILGEAESKVHGIPLEKIHFHEVGAIDSILDIIGAAICIEYVNPGRIFSSRVELGAGKVRCRHGLFPVPAPATAEILKGMPVRLGGVMHEATTPTGAAILAANVDEFVEGIRFDPTKVAYGVGRRETALPNVLRLFMGEDKGVDQKEVSVKQRLQDVNKESDIMLECNLDDMNPEVYPYLIERLFESGARDAFLTPVIMKKGRPGVILSVLYEMRLDETINHLIFSETTTLGVRRYPVDREMLERKIVTIETSLGPVAVKVAKGRDHRFRHKAEFESCKKIALKHKMPLQDVYQIIKKEIEEKFHQEKKA